MAIASKPGRADQNIPVTDVEKLHAESLQLRSQQFFIGTLALTGSGLALGFSTGLSTGSNLSSWIMLIILVSWLAVLVFLFYWSLSLKSIVMVISEYLKASKVDGKPATHWEGWYYSLPVAQGKRQFFGKSIQKNYLVSQTGLIKVAFWGYGAIASVVNIASYTIVGSSQKNDMSSGLFCSVVLILFTLYVLFIRSVRKDFERRKEGLTKQLSTIL